VKNITFNIDEDVIEKARAKINSFMFPIYGIYPGSDLINTAMDIKFETGYGFYDSLILAAAYKDNCKVIYSEDLTSGEKIRDMVLCNPFL